MVRFVGVDPRTASCTLSADATDKQNEAHFSNQGRALPAGQRIELRLAAAPIRLEAYARWAAVALLATVIGGSAAAAYRSHARPHSSSVERRKERRGKDPRRHGQPRQVAATASRRKR
jgi:hypothetical protein